MDWLNRIDKIMLLVLSIFIIVMHFKRIHFSLFAHFEHASQILSYHIVETDGNIFNNIHTQYVVKI